MLTMLIVVNNLYDSSPNLFLPSLISCFMGERKWDMITIEYRISTFQIFISKFIEYIVNLRCCDIYLYKSLGYLVLLVSIFAKISCSLFDIWPTVGYSLDQYSIYYVTIYPAWSSDITTWIKIIYSIQYLLTKFFKNSIMFNLRYKQNTLQICFEKYNWFFIVL